MHREMAGKATTVVEFVENCSSSELLEVGDYYKAIEDLCSMQLSFRDVQMFLFKPKLNVLLNLVGLHYCIFCLQVPVNSSCTLLFVSFCLHGRVQPCKQAIGSLCKTLEMLLR